MRLAASTRLGPYEILAPLGAGGMGEVYRARDTRLGRDVAIKVLPEHLLANPEVHARFEREARTISSLNHPHICTLHDVGKEGDVEYLVMELVDGETLAHRLERGPLPPHELTKLGIQIVDALDRAHRAGIVHRDFKPGNVMLTKSGAKLMDFGLARATGASATPTGSSTGVTIANLTASPTVASPLTAQGAIVGTYLYMAPEQLEGKETDARSDIWALGCVLYEMATGRRAFEGRTQASLIGAIMNTDPAPISLIAPMAPPQLDALVRACLAKDPDERIQTAHDVKLQLTWIASAGSQSSVAAPALPQRRFRTEPIAWAVAAVTAIAAVIFALRGLGGGTDGQQIRFTIPLPPTVVTVDLPRISPDGRMVAFAATDSSGRSMIWLRPMNSLVANPLPGTEGTNRPFWSPDSRWLAFTAAGKLRKVPVTGGPPEVICDAPNGYDGSWGKNGDILFDGRSDLDPILSVKASGGIAAPAMPVDSTVGVGWPQFLSDGRHYLYTTVPTNGPPQIMVAALGDKKGKPLGVAGSRVECSPDGYLIFARDRTLMAQKFDEGRFKTVGDPFPVAQDLPVSGSGQANFSVSGNGVLIYRATGNPQSRLIWVDHAGHETQELAAPADFRAPALSPDARRIAIRRVDGGNFDVWIIEPARHTSTRFTFDPVSDGSPLWSPDGSQIVWSHTAADTSEFQIKSAGGLGEPRSLGRIGINASPLDWSRDGRYLLYSAIDSKTGVDLYTMRMDTPDHAREVLLRTPFVESRARFSPDGRWVSYESDESGRGEIYVVAFQGSSGKWQVSTHGGSDARWSRDGKHLYYLVQNQRFMVVDIVPGESFDTSPPRELFRIQVEGGQRRNVYEVAPDGKRFLFQVPVGETNTPITAVVNWGSGSERR